MSKSSREKFHTIMRLTKRINKLVGWDFSGSITWMPYNYAFSAIQVLIKRYNKKIKSLSRLHT